MYCLHTSESDSCCHFSSHPRKTICHQFWIALLHSPPSLIIAAQQSQLCDFRDTTQLKKALVLGIQTASSVARTCSSTRHQRTKSC